jgi:replicative DNA helicase
MANQEDKLTQFGHNFQIKTISALLSDKSFIQQISDILLPEFFESESNQWIVSEILSYFSSYGQAPTLDVFKFKIQDISEIVLKAAVIDALKEALLLVESSDLSFIKNQTLDFCKNQCIKRAILESVEFLRKGKYDDIKSAMDTAMKAGSNRDVGYEFLENVAARYTENMRSTIETPWPVINELSDGGFGKGELIISVAGPGGGKCVGPDTLIDIQYEELTYTVHNYGPFNTSPEIVFNPFNVYTSPDKLQVWIGWDTIQQFKDKKDELPGTVDIKLIEKRLRIQDLFNQLHISEEENIPHYPKFELKVFTPEGWHKINHLFRTEKQTQVSCNFVTSETDEENCISGSETIICSDKHQFRNLSGEWTQVKDLQVGDYVECFNFAGDDVCYMQLASVEYLSEKASLYDLSVDVVHCYYTNSILSHNSTMMMNVGAHCIQKGLRVVHYTMELAEGYTAQRYDSIITSIATQNLKYNIDEVEATLKKKVNGELIIKYYPTKSASVNSLKAHIDQLILLDKKPDVVIVDYADLLRTSSKGRDKLHEDLEIVYEELRGLAGEYKIPVFTASQANRSSAEGDIITGEQIASSFSKVMIGDFVISLSRKVGDKLAGTGRFFIIKNRFGPDGITLPSKINMSTGQMNIYEETSVQGKETKQTMATGEDLLKKGLAQKYKEIQGLG